MTDDMSEREALARLVRPHVEAAVNSAIPEPWEVVDFAVNAIVDDLLAVRSPASLLRAWEMARNAAREIAFAAARANLAAQEDEPCPENSRRKAHAAEAEWIGSRIAALTPPPDLMQRAEAAEAREATAHAKWKEDLAKRLTTEVRIEAAERERDEARAALEPFTKLAPNKSASPLVGDRVPVAVRVQVGDLRRARRALSQA